MFLRGLGLYICELPSGLIIAVKEVPSINKSKIENKYKALHLNIINYLVTKSLRLQLQFACILTLIKICSCSKFLSSIYLVI